MPGSRRKATISSRWRLKRRTAPLSPPPPSRPGSRPAPGRQARLHHAADTRAPMAPCTLIISTTFWLSVGPALVPSVEDQEQKCKGRNDEPTKNVSLQVFQIAIRSSHSRRQQVIHDHLASMQGTAQDQRNYEWRCCPPGSNAVRSVLDAKLRKTPRQISSAVNAKGCHLTNGSGGPLQSCRTDTE